MVTILSLHIYTGIYGPVITSWKILTQLNLLPTFKLLLHSPWVDRQHFPFTAISNNVIIKMFARCFCT